ncbi:MAG TPA: hypothetical protein DCQ31_17825, partial [Bacteroidales bacterium]|nr:hypothetical protein [Bacteroidales bacterium]
MKKTFKININGSVFTIDDDAFEMLNNYIDRLKNKFTQRSQEAEVVTDIEARIAELFKDKLVNGKEVITLTDVKEVVSILGSPDQFDIENEEYTAADEYVGVAGRKLFRDPDDRVLGGVSAGISHYFGIDPIIIRVIFAVSFFVFGSGFLIYIIMWAVIPEARTTSEKLEMKGEPVNVKNIERSIKHEYESVKSNFQNIRGSEFAGQTRDITRKTAGGIVTLLSFIARVIVIFFGFIVVVTGVAILFSLAVGMLAGIGLLPTIGDQTFNEVPVLLSHVFDRQETDLFLISLILLIGLPVLGLVYWGFKLIFKFKVEDKVIGIIGLVSWIIGLLMVVSIGLFMAGEFKNSGNINNETVLKGLSSDTLIVSSFKPEMFTRNHEDGIGLNFEDFALIINDSASNVYIRPEFTIEESKSDSFILEVRYHSQGNSIDSAKINAQS